MRGIILYIFTILTFGVLVLNGQTYNFKNFGTVQGLASSNVNAIYQSQEGYIWFCTQGGGISRFDGKEFKTFTKADGLISNDVTTIVEDHDHNMWVGTAAGLSKYYNRTFTNFTEKDGPGNNTIYHSICDSKGNIWFATFGNGVMVYRNGKFTAFNTKSGFPTDETFYIEEDKEGNFWIGTFKNGICKINPEGKVLEHIKAEEGQPKWSGFTLKMADDGTLWIGTAGNGILKYKNKSLSQFPIAEVSTDIIGKIIIDKRKNIWLATEHGLVKITGNNYKIFSEHEGLSSIKVQTILQDYEENIWVGTLGGGADLFKNESIVTFLDKDGLSNNKIYAVCKTKRGFVLAGSFNGLDIFRNKKFERINEPKNIQGASITAITEDSKGRVWVGTEDHGVFVYEQNGNGLSFKQEFHKTGDVDLFQALKICEDSKGNIWFNAYGRGILKWDGKDFEQYNVANKRLPSDNILTIYIDKQDVVWASIYQEGIIKLTEGNVATKFESNGKLAICYSISGDNNGNIYFANADEGLGILTNGTLKIFDTKNGLSSNNAWALALSGNTTWLGTDKGVNKITLNKNLEIEDIKYYGYDEGFKGTDIVQNGIFIETNGKVWISTTNGLTKYDPAYDFKISAAPKLILSDIKLFYQHVDWKQYCDSMDREYDLPINPTLSYRNNHLTFNFQATTTEKVRYQFYMEGLDETWSPLTTKNEAVYTNIPPGKYVFRIKAQNPNGVWSEKIIEFPFEITPPFWKTWWFYSLIIIVSLIIIIGYIRWRTARLEIEKKVLEQKVEERTLELKEANHKLFDALQDIKDSINYAEKIQRAILPEEENIHKGLKESFVFFRPRDIVSGDFYWYVQYDGIDFIAAVDCTGHGVPGAFMSMIGSSLLNEIVTTKGIKDPGDILTALNKGVQDALKQNENHSRDGMDLALCAIDYKKRKVRYAGANRPLWIIRNSAGTNEVEEVKATKTAIGGFTDYYQQFAMHEIQLEKGDAIYLFTDGLPDQFGGEKGKKLMTKKFKEILIGFQKLSPKQQAWGLQTELEGWMGQTYEQVDDILVIGVRF